MAESSQPSEIAREALRRLAVRRLPPTPDNFRDLYHEIAGTPPAEPFPERAFKAIAGALPRNSPDQNRFARRLDAAIAARDWAGLREALAAAAPVRDQPERSWAPLVRTLLAELDRHHAGLTPTRKREALEHVLTAWGGDAGQLHERLQSLVRSWSLAPQAAGIALVEEGASRVAPDGAASCLAPRTAESGSAASREIREIIVRLLENAVAVLLTATPAMAEEAGRLAGELQRAAGPAALQALVTRTRQFVYRVQWAAEDETELKAGLLHLLQLIVENISELVVDDPWLQGQVAMLNELLGRPLDVRRLEDVERRLRDLIVKQSNLKKGLNEARDRMKEMLARFVDDLSKLTEATGEYHEKIERCAARISSASDIGQLSAVVEEVMRETRQIQLSALRSRDELRSVRSRVEDAEREVARLQEALAQASDLVRRDQLTGVLNRKGLAEAVERELVRGRRRAAPLCVALLDIDNFKKLNDTYGHQTGDAALVHLAGVMRESLRPQDTVARYGGEEFVILLPDTRPDEGAAALVRLQRELTRRIFLHGNERTLITFSAGLAQVGAAETAEQALARADAAMYQAKRAGRNRVVTDLIDAPAGA